MCPRCEKEEDTVGHWLMRCPAVAGAKMRIFGRVELEYSILTMEPGKVLALAKSSLFGPPAGQSQ